MECNLTSNLWLKCRNYRKELTTVNVRECSLTSNLWLKCRNYRKVKLMKESSVRLLPCDLKVSHGIIIQKAHDVCMSVKKSSFNGHLN
jgi:hypothetical protein